VIEVLGAGPGFDSSVAHPPRLNEAVELGTVNKKKENCSKKLNKEKDAYEVRRMAAAAARS
jgi:hypothetical protein